MEFLDGKIKWTAPAGPLGKKMKALNDNLASPIVQFQPIPNDMPDVDPKVFSESSDLRRYRELGTAISTGIVPEKFITNEYEVLSTIRLV